MTERQGRQSTVSNEMCWFQIKILETTQLQKSYLAKKNVLKKIEKGKGIEK